MFDELGLSICEGNNEYYEYLKKSIAYKIQYPHKKLPFAFVLKSDQGGGKNTFLKFISNIFGSPLICSTSEPDEIFGTFNEIMHNKLLLCLEESDGKKVDGYISKIKSLITEDTVVINGKFKNMLVANNTMLIFFLTNKNDGIRIDANSGERRFIVFQADGKMNKKTPQYWASLRTLLDKPVFTAALYKYFNEMDVSTYNFYTNRPITQTYLDLVKNNVNFNALLFDMYLEREANENGATSNKLYNIPFKQFYDDMMKTATYYKMYNSDDKKPGSTLFSRSFEEIFKTSRQIDIDINNYGISNFSASGVEIYNNKDHNTKYIRYIPDIVYSYYTSKNWVGIRDPGANINKGKIAAPELVAAIKDEYIEIGEQFAEL
jgi:hypothetical protein